VDRFDVQEMAAKLFFRSDAVSGICGICQPGRKFERGSLSPMLAAVALPGDEKPSEVTGPDFALGITPRWPGQQLAAIPGVKLVLDAEIVNTDEWNDILARTGLSTNQMSLGEKVAWLYVLLGVDFLGRLEGSFSLALWDEKQSRLLLAIDRLGISSLYWRREGDHLLFGSRAGAIRAAQDSPSEINPTALMQYFLFTTVPAPLGIYKGLQKLRPGYCLLCEGGQEREQQYWDMEYPEGRERKQDWSQELGQGIRAAVHRSLDGCQPETTGAYLSGGTDSSSVVAFAAEQFSPVNTFSIYFAEERYSEIGYARITANRFRTQHHESRLTSEDALAAIPKICAYYDEPFANSSAIGAYHCAAMAQKSGVTTLLAGDGGDEIFAGNERYASDRKFAKYGLLPGWLRKGFIEPAISLLPENGSWLSLPARYVRRAGIPNPRRIFSYGPFFSTPPEEVFEPDFLNEVPPDGWMHIADEHYGHNKDASELNKLMYFDLKMILADNDLRKVAGTAELAGVRVRFPLLDHSLVELTGRIPSNLKMRGSEKRYIFKQAMQGILPAEVLSKKKHGFGVPLGLWLLEEPTLKAKMNEVLNDPQVRQRGYVRRQFLDRLLSMQKREDAAFYGEALWSVLALELWHRQQAESQTRSACVL
jgi:asparagine synthase (glutamine-hydrolysing)